MVCKVACKINPTKINLLPLTRIRAPIHLTLYNTPIIPTQTAKLLGTTFDKTMTLHSHTHNLRNKANHRINLLRLVKGNQLGASPETLIKHSKPKSSLSSQVCITRGRLGLQGWFRAIVWPHPWGSCRTLHGAHILPNLTLLTSLRCPSREATWSPGVVPRYCLAALLGLMTHVSWCTHTS